MVSVSMRYFLMREYCSQHLVTFIKIIVLSTFKNLILQLLSISHQKYSVMEQLISSLVNLKVEELNSNSIDFN